MDCVAPPSKGGDAIHQWPLDAVALCFLLTCALPMTSSHSEDLLLLVQGMMSSPDLMSNVSSMITTSRLTPAHTTLLGCNLLHLAASESTGEALRIVSSLFSKAELKAAANVRENQEHPSNLLEDTEGVAPLLWG